MHDRDQFTRRIPGGDENVTDPNVFAALYLQAYPTLRVIAAGIIGDSAHAEDIVQDAAMIALGKIDDFAAGSSLLAWLSEIVRRCSLNYARKRQNRRTVPTDPLVLTETSLEEAAAAGRCENVVAATGELADVQSEFDDETVRALGALSQTARCCLLLRVVRNLSYAEISEVMGIPQGTAMSHVHRGRRVMREKLAASARVAKVKRS